MDSSLVGFVTCASFCHICFTIINIWSRRDRSLLTPAGSPPGAVYPSGKPGRPFLVQLAEYSSGQQHLAKIPSQHLNACSQWSFRHVKSCRYHSWYHGESWIIYFFWTWIKVKVCFMFIKQEYGYRGNQDFKLGDIFCEALFFYSKSRKSSVVTGFNKTSDCNTFILFR